MRVRFSIAQMVELRMHNPSHWQFQRQLASTKAQNDLRALVRRPTVVLSTFLMLGSWRAATVAAKTIGGGGPAWVVGLPVTRTLLFDIVKLAGAGRARTAGR
jgi:hypothetical protein